MFFPQRLNRYVIPRTELIYPCHVLKMHQNAAAAPVDRVMADVAGAIPDAKP
ncbi:MAG TPA: hypothetical protein VFT91_00090 [Dehalococcoidia bacterium]|nr:hypothetical protein [Dehalococcoidia bacterium]